MPEPEYREDVRRQALLVALCTLFLMALWQVSPGINDDGKIEVQSRSLPRGDSAYHIRMAWLYRTGEISEAGNNFHWMRGTIWNGRFADKDYLYHLFLVPFTWGASEVGDTKALIWGAKLSTALMGMMLALTLFAVLRSFGVRHAWLFVLLALLFGSHGYLSRANECRNWHLSVAFSLIGWSLMARGRWYWLTLLAMGYTLSYAASHFLVLLWFVRTAGGLIVGPGQGLTRVQHLKRDFILLGAIVLGIGIGVLLHPGRFDLPYTWYVQTILVPMAAHNPGYFPPLSGMWKGQEGMVIGREMLSSDGDAILRALLPSLAAPIVLPLVAALWRWRPNRECLLTSGAALLTLTMAFTTSRFIEYLGPFMALAVGMWVMGLLESRGAQARRKLAPRAMKWGPIALAAFLACWVGWETYGGFKERSKTTPRVWRTAGEWLNKQPDMKGKLVYNPHWDRFSDLLFYSPQCDYIVGLDPLYMHAWDAKKSNG